MYASILYAGIQIWNHVWSGKSQLSCAQWLRLHKLTSSDLGVRTWDPCKLALNTLNIVFSVVWYFYVLVATFPITFLINKFTSIVWMIEFWMELMLLKNNTIRNKIAQANTHTQRHMHNAWNELVIFTSCFVIYCICFPLFVQSICAISTLTS